MLQLTQLDGTWAVCRLPADAALPAWALDSPWISITRTADELSIVAPVTRVPDGVRSEGPWAMLRVAGTLDFSEVGILAGLTAALADAEISVFALSTFDTDYLLVGVDDAPRAREALTAAGYR